MIQLRSTQTSAPIRLLISALGIALFLSMAGLATSAQAQDEGPQPKRYEDVTWNEVVLVDFKAGKEDRAMEIIEDHYNPATRKAGTQVPRHVNLQTGPWDLMLIWTLQDGPSEMAWETSPEDAKFEKAFVEMHGEEKAQEIGDEITSAIARTTSFVGFSGRHGAPITAEMAE